MKTTVLQEIEVECSRRLKRVERWQEGDRNGVGHEVVRRMVALERPARERVVQEQVPHQGFTWGDTRRRTLRDGAEAPQRGVRSVGALLTQGEARAKGDQQQVDAI